MARAEQRRCRVFQHATQPKTVNDLNIVNEAMPQRRADRRQLIAGLTEAVLLPDPNRTIVRADEAVFSMHGITSREELGADVQEYRERFEPRYRNNHVLAEGDFPADRMAAGEIFDGATSEAALVGHKETRRVHPVRSLALTNAGDRNLLAFTALW
jgi:PAS domain-containing protein